MLRYRKTRRSTSGSTGPPRCTRSACSTTGGKVGGQLHRSRTPPPGSPAADRPAGPAAAPAEEIPVGIERPNGRLVDLLLEAGHPVVPVSPNAIKTWRDGEVLSGAKSDAGDAAVIAEYLRLRAHRLQVAAPLLRRDQGVADGGPHPRRPGRHAGRSDQPARRPAGCALARRQGDLRRHRIADRVGVPDPLPDRRRGPPPGRETPRRVLRQARLLRPPLRRASCSPGCARAPAGTLDDTLTEAVRDAVLALVAVLTALGAALKDLDRSVAAHLGEHPDGQIFTSLPRSGQINAAQVLAEWGDVREAYDSPDAVAALAGITPVTKAVRQTPRRALPLGLQQTLPPGDHHLRRQQPPRQPLGRARSTTTPAPAARTTPTPSASSPAPGSASSGAAGRTASPTTRPSTAARTRSTTSRLRHEVDIGSVMRRLLS